MSENYIVISDLQIPYEADHALQFCRYVKRHFKIKDENVYNVGDETDQFHGSDHPKDGDYDITPKEEIRLTKEKLREWYAEFPQMKLAISNHGLRWVRKASNAQIPVEIIRDYRDIIDAPKGWQWRDKWLVESKHPFLVLHGMGYSGQTAYRQIALDHGISVAHGHLHSGAGISYIKTDHQKIWGFNTGCLINPVKFAFKYGRWARFKPSLGIGVVTNGGTTPIWLPYD